jgi:hypothetical protein
MTRALHKTGKQMLERVVDQLWTISRLVMLKYRRIRFAMTAFGVAAIVVTASVARGTIR